MLKGEAREAAIAAVLAFMGEIDYQKEHWQERIYEAVPESRGLLPEMVRRGLIERHRRIGDSTMGWPDEIYYRDLRARQALGEEERDE